MKKEKTKIKFFLFAAALAAVFSFNSAAADTLGKSRVFYVDSYYDASGRTQISANLKYVSERAYFYADADYFNSLTAPDQSTFQNNLSSLAAVFDQTIYPKLVSVFGAEPNPGVDGDSRITILLERMFQSAGGYFLKGNGYQKAEAQN